MMSSFTTLKKNSRFKSACPSSGPATFCEGSRPRLRTQSGHVHIRSRRVHARSFRCTNLCNFLSASVGIFAAAVRLYSAAPLWVITGGTSGSVGTKHFLGPHCLWVFTFRQDASAAASTDTAPATSAGAFFWSSHQRPNPLMGHNLS